MSETKTI